ncbi:hypothetical protein MYCTH_2294181 [Thermothelomyces thermophilus ATCC 42464]|uniref:Zn(2)-C6 fungal-type domain-containing protein n=1 Tax=Thermothelomyces thermophilus (strain ATCC 42464 / BCRC 31852 / DSM 1799) TaxID=573729 RepID=G2Q0B6_THET4|nr:uncharacterized protein MYCTH_2294181 [Thermothelomyces thermophilus ATCC 42464]AEO53179.1 hypothetical protein MYCTH_2294181 [Thermothelomyces thermophilus ATCC 42464]
MPTQSYSDEQEKDTTVAQADDGLNSGCGSQGLFPGTDSGSGWTGARLADCFASFSMCPPFEPQSSYQPLLARTSYEYDDNGSPGLDTTVVSVQPQAQVALVTPPVISEPSSLFPCDDPALMAQYLPNYPPLQPERITGLQPATSREEMIYPIVSAAGNADGAHCVSALRGQPQHYAPVQTGAVPVTYAGSSDASPFNGHGIVMNPPPRFHSVQCFDVVSRIENASTQNDSPVLDFFPAQRTAPVKRGPFKDQDSREKTALTRKMGSCIRCRMQRIRCNLDPENEKGPCLSCKKIASSAKVYRLNCLRLKITDVKLFKPGQVKGQEWTSRWKDSVMDDIGSWEPSQPRVIRVTEGYTGRSVELQVRQFKPQQGDKVKRSWVSKDGRRHEVQIPTYAIVNMDDAKASFDKYIRTSLGACCKHLLSSRDELLSRTYFLAIKLAQNRSTPQSERSLLVATFELWMSVRLTTKSFEIVGDDTLGMPRNIIDDKDSPLHGKIPLPPVMGAQIDSVIIHQIQPRLRRKTLEELQKMTQEKKQKTWLTTFLVTFILLHNIALITKHDADYARKHGLPTRFAREANVKEYNLGANTLLAYFHYCNKAIYPFSRECKDQDLQTLAELDDEALAFVHFVRESVAKKKEEWEKLWAHDEYEHEYYYVSQLFEHNWQPRTMA